MSKIGLKKEAILGKVWENDSCDVTDEELKLINGYTRRELSKDEVYVFSVVLCDNDIDRDGERFTVESLFELEKLFVGKTGIFDHNPTAKNQTARIFACKVEAVDGRKTATGDDYFRLKARAYLPVSEKNSDVILALDSGIIKEVSVGCAVEQVLCSICGERTDTCPHKKGEKYGSKICCGELVNPYDAYEWSFVAVPSQKFAGVTKSAQIIGKENDMDNIMGKLELRKGVTLSSSECVRLLSYIENLKQSAKDGVYYRDSLTAEVVKLSATVQPEISRETMESVAKTMTVSQLNEFKKAFEKKKNDTVAPVLQLGNRKNNKKDTVSNGQFTI